LRQALGLGQQPLKISAESLSDLARFSVKKKFGCAMLRDPDIISALFGRDHRLTTAALEGGVRLHLVKGAFRSLKGRDGVRARKRPEVEDAMWQQVEFLMENGAAEWVDRGTKTFDCTPVVISSPFLHPKVDEATYDVSIRAHSRFIVNMKPTVNLVTASEKFRQDDVEAVRQMITADAFLAKFDQVQAYHQTPIFPAHRQLCRFHIFDPASKRWRVGQLHCLTMGLSPSARIQTQLGSAVIKLLQQNGGRACIKIDDWLFAGDSAAETLRSTWIALAVLVAMGSCVHFDPSKSHFKPTRSLEYIGVSWRTATSKENPWGLCVMPDPKVTKFLSAVSWMRARLQTEGRLSSRAWLKKFGIVASALDCIPALWLYTRRLAAVGRFLAAAGLDTETLVPQELINDAEVDLAFWLSTDSSEWNGAPLLKLPAMAFAHADSSLWASGLFAPADYLCSNRNPEAVDWSEFWNGEEQSGEREHINPKELRGSCRRLIELIRHRDYRRIVLGVGLDSTVALAYYPRLHGRKWGGRQVARSDDTWELFQECKSRQLIITSVHVPGEEMLADAASRRKVSISDFALSAQAFRAIMTHFGALGDVQLDLFADAATKKCPRYVSKNVDSRAVWTNAFARSWRGLRAFANPPLKLIPQIVAKFEADEGSRLILVAPLFWNNTLQRILRCCRGPPLILPRHSEAFAPPLGWQQTREHQLLPSARVSKDHWTWIAFDLSPARCDVEEPAGARSRWSSGSGKMLELTWTGTGGYLPSSSERAQRICKLLRACMTS
jgi:hypothetical protein